MRFLYVDGLRSDGPGTPNPERLVQLQLDVPISRCGTTDVNLSSKQTHAGSSPVSAAIFALR